MTTTKQQQARLNDVPSVSIKVSQVQLEALEQQHELFSRMCDNSEHILDCMALQFEDCVTIGKIIDMNPEEFAGQYVIFSVN